ncbi:TIGR02452 family protein [Candidatus Bipolaricaulota bacterium]|nr:TIGR02452 family protein [Candidatus Bipolaricaulota bacterium]
MNNRRKLVRVARETVEILDRGYYRTKSGSKVDIEDVLNFAIENTKLYRPEELEKLETEPPAKAQPSVRVVNATTLEAARGLIEAGKKNPFVLNFASARNPGGGFLNGSGAQEESLSRKSGLYACISQINEYYRENELSNTALYTDYMIYSPRVPVFRDKEYQLIDSPFYVSILTAPAVNRSAVENNEPENLPEVMSVMNRRINKVLKAAEDNGHESLVLGAWGCGVFGNSPKEISELFKKNLYGDPKQSFGFQDVVFAVLDRSTTENTFKTFQRVLEKGN